MTTSFGPLKLVCGLKFISTGMLLLIVMNRGTVKACNVRVFNCLPLDTLSESENERASECVCDNFTLSTGNSNFVVAQQQQRQTNQEDLSRGSLNDSSCPTSGVCERHLPRFSGVRRRIE